MRGKSVSTTLKFLHLIHGTSTYHPLNNTFTMSCIPSVFFSTDTVSYRRITTCCSCGYTLKTSHTPPLQLANDWYVFVKGMLNNLFLGFAASPTSPHDYDRHWKGVCVCGHKWESGTDDFGESDGWDDFTEALKKGTPCKCTTAIQHSCRVCWCCDGEDWVEQMEGGVKRSICLKCRKEGGSEDQIVWRRWYVMKTGGGGVQTMGGGRETQFLSMDKLCPTYPIVQSGNSG